MFKPTDIDSTLPSIAASLGRQYGEQVLALTIIFHPDTSRIGQRAVVPQQKGETPWLLGRRCPLFYRGDGGGGEPLNDPHVSRRALQFTLSGKRLLIQRFDATSRCRLGQAELVDSVEVEWTQLRHGLPIMMGHGIVLLLRVACSTMPDCAAAAPDSFLRGSSVSMTELREQVARAGDSDLDVLVRGETGTGKELVARAIHSASRRAQAPIVSVNMAAIPSELAASALFGSARGAFTGSNESVAGYFEQAEGGSLFLDEIGDTACSVQPQLLRALQQREIQSVGGPIRRVDVRVISATDVELDACGGDFKAALRHRLGACEILLPPLREHPEDIGELLLYFLCQSAAEAGRPQLMPHPHSDAADIAAWAMLFYTFVTYHWPGNVRELANFAQQVVLNSEDKPLLPDTLRSAMATVASPASVLSRRHPYRKIQDIDDDTFEQAMLANDCEVARVALQLKVSRAAVYRRIEASSSYRLACDIPLQELQGLMLAHAGDSAEVARQLRVSLNSLRAQLRKLSTEQH